MTSVLVPPQASGIPGLWASSFLCPRGRAISGDQSPGLWVAEAVLPEPRRPASAMEALWPPRGPGDALSASSFFPSGSQWPVAGAHERANPATRAPPRDAPGPAATPRSCEGSGQNYRQQLVCDAAPSTMQPAWAPQSQTSQAAPSKWQAAGRRPGKPPVWPRPQPPPPVVPGGWQGLGCKP